MQLRHELKLKTLIKVKSYSYRQGAVEVIPNWFILSAFSGAFTKCVISAVGRPNYAGPGEVLPHSHLKPASELRRLIHD